MLCSHSFQIKKKLSRCCVFFIDECVSWSIAIAMGEGKEQRKRVVATELHREFYVWRWF
jgi:hypothetical protein